MKKLIIIFVLSLLSKGNIYASPLARPGDDKIPNTTDVRYSQRSTLPNYIAFEKTHYLPESSFKIWIQRFFADGNVDFIYIRSTKDRIGITQTQYQQRINGIEVQDGIVTTHSVNGMIRSISGEMYPSPSKTNIVSISKETARQIALNFIGAKKYRWEIPGADKMLQEQKRDPSATFFPIGDLTLVYPENSPGKTFRLAYRFDIFAMEPLVHKMIWIDVSNGKVLYTRQLLQDVNSPGTTTTLYSSSQNITTDLTSTGNYRLRESNRAGGVDIQTLDMNNGTNYYNAVDFTNTTNTWLSDGNTDAHWGAEEVVDFYWTKLNRNSIDGNGMTVYSYVHYDNALSNAYWDGYEMSYGDGQGNNTPFTALDVCGHEMTHGVSQYMVGGGGLNYAGESGALNESFSDIFGNTIEHFSRPSQYSWLIGEDIFSGGIRNMSNPNSFNDPDTYQGLHWASTNNPNSTNDYGGVHTNSGVQNYAYYLMVTGGSGTNDNGNSYNITGIGWDDAINIVYKALTYLSTNSNFSDSRAAMVQAAIDIFGACSQQVITTTNAWYAVGVGSIYTGGAVISDFIASPTIGCTTPFVVNFTNIGSTTNGNTYLWTFGDGSTSNLQNPTHTYSNYGNYTVSLTITPSSANCNSDTETKTNYISLSTTNNCIYCDTINDPPPGTLTIYSIQSGGYVSGTNSVGDKAFANKFSTFTPFTHVTGALVYFYGVRDGGNNASVQFNVMDATGTGGSPGNIIKSSSVSLLTLQNNLSLSGGQYIGTVAIDYPEPVAVTTPYYLAVKLVGFGSNDSLGIVTNTDADSPTNLFWVLGNNNIWNEVTNRYYLTSLDSYIAPIMTETPPKAIINANTTTVCAGSSIHFSGTNSQNASTNGYTWTFTGGNNSTSTDTATTITYSMPGIYQAILQVEGNCSGISSDTVVITVLATPNISATANPTQICLGDSTTLTATGGNSYSWDNGLGTSSSQVVSPTTTTSYQVTGYNSSCSSTFTLVVTVNNPADASFHYPSSIVCSNANQLTPVITNLGGNFSATPAGLNINGTTGVINPSISLPNSYIVKYTISGICGDSSLETITINTSNDASFAYPTGSICIGGGNITPMISNLGGAFTATPAGLTINPSTGEVDPSTSSVGNYLISYSFSGICGDTVAHNLSITANGDASFHYSNNSICQDTNLITATVNSSGGNFSATPNGLTIDLITGDINPLTSIPGSYIVKYELSGACSASTIQNIDVHPLPDVSLGEDIISCIDDQPIHLIGIPSGGIFSGLGVNGNTFNPGIGIGNYLINYTFTNNWGCSNTDQITVQVDSCLGIVTLSQNYLMIVPNPAKEKISILVSDNNTIQDVRLITDDGKLVQSTFKKIKENKCQLDISKLAKGMYYVYVTTGNGVIIDKIVKVE